MVLPAKVLHSAADTSHEAKTSLSLRSAAPEELCAAFSIRRASISAAHSDDAQAPEEAPTCSDRGAGEGRPGKRQARRQRTGRHQTKLTTASDAAVTQEGKEASRCIDEAVAFVHMGAYVKARGSLISEEML